MGWRPMATTTTMGIHMKDEALKLAREALEEHGGFYLHHENAYKPVAWMTDYGEIVHANDHARWVKFDGGKGFERFSDYVIPLYTTPPAQPAPVQERTDYAVHLNHCNIGECEGVCKYLDDDCPALKHAITKAAAEIGKGMK